MSQQINSSAGHSATSSGTFFPNESANMFSYYNKYEDKGDYYKDLIIFGLYSLTVVFSVFGNAIVCYVSFVLRSKSTTYLLLGNMAVSDLLSGLVIPLQWIFCSTYFLDMNERICGSFKTLQVVSYFISTFTMALIAMDRYTILRNPLARRVRPFISIATIWTLGILLNIPTLVAMRASEYWTPNRMIYCRIILKLDPATSGLIRKYRVSLVVLSQYFIPLVIATIFYSLCIRKMVSRKRIGESTNQQDVKFDRSKMRTIKMLVLSLMAFIVAWLPVHLMHLIDFFIYPLLPKECNSSFTYNLFYWLSISSSSFNPFIYCYFDSKFRSTTRKFCGCCLYPCNRDDKHQQLIVPAHTNEPAKKDAQGMSDVSTS